MVGTHKIHQVTIEDKVYPLGYRVVTEDLRSLGLRRNPNILTYPVGEWYILPAEELEEGPGDWGGIWVARIPSGAYRLREYMLEKHKTKTRLFKATLGDILYINSYRIKTDKMMMFEEM